MSEWEEEALASPFAPCKCSRSLSGLRWRSSVGWGDENRTFSYHFGSSFIVLTTLDAFHSICILSPFLLLSHLALVPRGGNDGPADLGVLLTPLSRCMRWVRRVSVLKITTGLASRLPTRSWTYCLLPS